jgi:GAF domain-containing protein
MPLDQAIAILRRDSGKMFDPKVVEVLSRRYKELERTAREKILNSRPIIQTDVKVERGAAPDAGFESNHSADLRRLHTTLNGGDPARLMACGMFAQRAQAVIAFDALGIFVESGETLYNVYSDGPSAAAIQDLAIPIGKGLVGWVAKNHQPIINGNPAVEPGLMDRPEGPALSSAMAVPIEGGAQDAFMVVCLYRRDRDAFHRDQLNILLALGSDFHARALAPAP